MYPHDCQASKAGALKAGEEEAELEPNIAVAAATSTTTTAPSPAEVARTVFAGIIATCCLYVAYRVGTEAAEAEISEIWVLILKTTPSPSAGMDKKNAKRKDVSAFSLEI